MLNMPPYHRTSAKHAISCHTCACNPFTRFPGAFQPDEIVVSKVLSLKVWSRYTSSRNLSKPQLLPYSQSTDSGTQGRSQTLP